MGNLYVSPLSVALGKIVFILLLFVGLYLLNYKKDQRHTQLIFVCAASFFLITNLFAMIGFTYFTNLPFLLWTGITQLFPGLSWVWNVLAGIGTLFLTIWNKFLAFINASGYTFLTKGIFLLGSYFLTKTSLKGISLFGGRMIRLFRWVVNIFYKSNVVKEKSLSSFAKKFYVISDEDFFLKNEYVMVGRFLLTIACIIILFLIIETILFSDGGSYSIYKQFTPHSNISFIGLNIEDIQLLIAVLFLEMAWYLDGPALGDSAGEDIISGEDMNVTSRVEWLELITDYETTWGYRLLNKVFLPLKAKNTKGSSWKEVYDDKLKYQLEHYPYVIVKNPNYNSLQEELFQMLEDRLHKFERILFVTPVEKKSYIVDWVAGGMSKLSQLYVVTPGEIESNLGIGIWKIGTTFNNADISKQQVLIVDYEELKSAVLEKNKWLELPDTIIFPWFNCIDVSSCYSTFHLLSENYDSGFSQAIVLSQEQRGIENSVRSIVGLKRKQLNDLSHNVKEYIQPQNSLKLSIYLLWKGETVNQQKFQDNIAGHIGQSFGANVALSLHAQELKNNKKINISTIYENEHDYQDRLDIITTNINTLDDNIVLENDSKLFNIQSIMTAHSYNNHLIIVNDEQYNTPSAARKFVQYASREVLMNIISPPYLLRGYFSDNFLYFIKNKPIESIATGPSSSDSSKADQILRLMTKQSVSKEVIENVLSYDTYHNLLVELNRLFVKIYDLNIFVENFLQRSGECFSLDRSIFDKIPWLQEYELVLSGEHNVLLDTVIEDCLYQNFLKGQIIKIKAKSYHIDNIVPINKQIICSQREPENDIQVYRTDFSLKINTALAFKLIDPVISNGIKLEITNYELDCDVDINGYYKFMGKISPEESEYVQQYHTRYYKNANAIRVTFDCIDTSSTGLSFTVAVLLNEIFPTLFPDKFQYIKVFSIDNLPEQTDKVSKFVYDITPHLGKQADLSKKGDIDVLVMIDCHIDIGVLDSLSENIDYIFEIIYDYLSWQQKNDSSLCENFLTYGSVDQKIPDILNLNELYLFLQKSYKNSQMTQLREQFFEHNIATNTEDIVEDSGQLGVCDFCADSYSAIDLDLLDDGRERCSTCSKTATDRLEDAKQPYENAKNFLEEIGYPIKNTMSVSFVRAHTIAAELGYTFVATPGFDSRALGFSRFGDEIYVEGGMPEYMLESVLVHELTHQWQHENLGEYDYDDEGDKRYIEGHAVCIEIQYLEKLNEYPEYVRRHKESSDPIYGDGYRLVVEEIEELGVNSSFELLKQKFPK